MMNDSFEERDQEYYDPNKLLNFVGKNLQVHGDVALAEKLDVSLQVLRNIRKSKVPVAGWLLLRMQEETQISVEQLRDLLGDRREKIRVSTVGSHAR